MGDYYNDEDLGRFGEIGKHKPELFKKFMDWYNSSLEPGLLTKREKVLIGLAVAHAVQCPYCIDSYTQSCLAEGMTLEHITEAVHVASAIKGGATLIHGIQAHNAADKIFL
jgi:alkylhydroperoxidase/carboxymuconolactone decarboxylase family protein